MCISEYKHKQRLFLATHINWKWTFGILGQWCCQNVLYKIHHLMICIIIKTFSNNWLFQGILRQKRPHYQLTCITKKSLGLNSILYKELCDNYRGVGELISVFKIWRFHLYQLFRSIWLLYVDVGAHHEALLNFQVTDMSCTVWQRHIKLLIAL